MEGFSDDEDDIPTVPIQQIQRQQTMPTMKLNVICFASMSPVWKQKNQSKNMRSTVITNQMQQLEAKTKQLHKCSLKEHLGLVSLPVQNSNIHLASLSDSANQQLIRASFNQVEEHSIFFPCLESHFEDINEKILKLFDQVNLNAMLTACSKVPNYAQEILKIVGKKQNETLKKVPTEILPLAQLSDLLAAIAPNLKTNLMSILQDFSQQPLIQQGLISQLSQRIQEVFSDQRNRFSFEQILRKFLQNDMITNETHYYQLISIQEGVYMNMCLLTNSIIRIPVRLKSCGAAHFSAFDLFSVLDFFISHPGTRHFDCPICEIPFNPQSLKTNYLFEFLDELYIDYHYMEAIKNSFILQPVWTVVPHQNTLTAQDQISNEITPQQAAIFNSVIETTSTPEYQDALLQKYRSLATKQVKFKSNECSRLPIPVRCMNCIKTNRMEQYCDLFEQLQSPKNCLVCGAVFKSLDDLRNELVLDLFIYRAGLRLVQLGATDFQVQYSHETNVLLVTGLKADLESNFPTAIEYIEADFCNTKSINFNQEFYLDGTMVNWSNCQHETYIDFVYDQIPTYCPVCKKFKDFSKIVTYAFEDELEKSSSVFLETESSIPSAIHQSVFQYPSLPMDNNPAQVPLAFLAPIRRVEPIIPSEGNPFQHPKHTNASERKLFPSSKKTLVPFGTQFT